MKTFLVALFFITSTIGTVHAQLIRQQLLFNADWKFHKGDIDSAQKRNVNDGQWRTVELPHDWSIEGPFSKEWASGTAFLPGGIGWYRKSFTVSKEWKGKNIFIYFDGVYKNSEVWINGHYLGKRPNGFIAFEYELTRYLNYSGENSIAVKVDHAQFADSRWYTGSGIYRNVYLQAVDPVHIDLWGVAFTSSKVSTLSAKAAVSVTIRNNKNSNIPVFVETVLIDENGKRVAKSERNLHLLKGGSDTAHLSLLIEKPNLWSVEHPHLYTIYISVKVKGVKVDEYSEKVGIRTFRFDANEGFFLNGVNMKLKGVCVHDDAGVLGVAVSEEVWIRRLRKLKEMGCNSLRFSHNPHADYLYKICDAMGFLVMDEAFDEWQEGKNKWVAGWNKGVPTKDGYHQYFTEEAEKDIRDMILRNRNRPSIIMWSIGNEIDYPNDPYSHEILNEGKNPQIYGKGFLPDHPPVERLSALSKQLVKAVKRYDTTRPVTAALAGVVMSNTTEYPGNIDIVGYNYQEYRYSEDHAKYPGRIIFGSENGMQLSAWNEVINNKYISGQYLWTGIDYLGEARDYPNRSNTAGLLDLAGFPKSEYYFRQSLWSTKPMIYLGVSEIPKTEDRGIWSHKRAEPVWNQKTGDSVRVNCFTNCSEAELFLNNVSLGKKTLTDSKNRILSWDLVYKPGELKVKGYQNGKELTTCSLLTPGKVHTIKAQVFKDVMIDANSGIKQIEITLNDLQGQTVYESEHEVTVMVTGDADLLGLENGSSTDVAGYQSIKTKSMNGRLIAYVRAGNKDKTFAIKIASPGIQPAILHFNKGRLE